MSSNTLLPCPFCAAPADDFEDGEIQCSNPKCEVRPHTFSEYAWNTRADSSQSLIRELTEAAEANMAWHLAEEFSLGTFQARMELCSYSQWLTRKALGEVTEYEGVPRLLLDLETVNVELARCDVANCKELVREALERAALTKAKGSHAA